jgi:hypothetical protein
MEVFRSRWICTILPLVFLVFPLWGAEITVPRLEMATQGANIDGSFALSTNTAVDIALNGGYKYGFLLGFSFDATDLGRALAYRNFTFAPAPSLGPTDPVDVENYNKLAERHNELADRYNNQATLSFRIAKATARDLFGLPLEFSYFAGLGDPFCSGEEFASRYGIFDVGTSFTGFFYFPRGIGGNPSRRYNGLHSVQGTGFSLAFTEMENYIPFLYFYQNFTTFDGDLLFEKPQFSGDVRSLFNFERIQAETYGGISGVQDGKIEVRGGVLAFFRSGMGTEFLLQCGIPGWKLGEEFSIDNVYLLFEPRLKFGIFAVHTTFFYHPLEYLHIKTEEERGKADINIKFLVDFPKNSVQGGVETTLGLQVYGMADYSAAISPFVCFLSRGLQWDMKLRVNLLEWETPENVFEIFVGVKTSF